MATRPAPTNSTSTLVVPLLQTFFMDHLTRQKRVSPRTIQSYRDTFRLLLQFVRNTTGKEPATLVMMDLDAPAVLQFLEHLEVERHNQVQSRATILEMFQSSPNQ